MIAARLAATEVIARPSLPTAAASYARALRSLWPSREKTQARLGASPPSGVTAGLPVNNRSTTAQAA
jgi:hypothetical protein